MDFLMQCVCSCGASVCMFIPASVFCVFQSNWARAMKECRVEFADLSVSDLLGSFSLSWLVHLPSQLRLASWP